MPRRTAGWVRLALLLSTLGMLWWLGSTLDLKELLESRSPGDANDPQRIVAFAGIIAVGVLAFVPGMLLAITAGASMGWKLGLVAAMLGSNLAANVAFAISRLMGAGVVTRLTGRRFRRLESLSEDRGFEILLYLRLLSVVPFLNYGAGLTTVRWRDYAAATLLGTLPSSFLAVYFGDHLDPRSPVFWLCAALIVALIALPQLLRRFRVAPPAMALLQPLTERHPEDR